MIKKILISALFFLYFLPSFAQPTFAVTDPQRDVKQVAYHIDNGEYALAYPLLKELLLKQGNAYEPAYSYVENDLVYFNILCELRLQQSIAETDAVAYLSRIGNNPRSNTISYELAHYYFLQKDYEKAIVYFEKTGVENLTNDQIADAKFEKAYSYFNLKQFASAKPLFNEIHQLPEHKYYIAANYYYGFISYADKQYDEALNSFTVVELDENYKTVVPYYISEIKYFQGKKDEALAYGEKTLAENGNFYYSSQLNLLLGQIYFENKNYNKALPLLESYVKSSDKVTKEVLYELSYSYYQNKQYEKAISGFKQLSSEKDSLGQNSMYLLGDLYLQTKQKENARNAFQYSAFNSSNAKLQNISRFHYAKLSYELGYQDVALKEMKAYVKDFPGGTYDEESKEILVNLLANTNNFKDALSIYQSFESPSASLQKVLPRLQYGRAIEFVNEQKFDEADALFGKAASNTSNNTVSALSSFWRGEIAYKQERFDESINFLNKYLLARAPASEEANETAARYTIGYNYIQQENYSKALPYFEDVVKTTPEKTSLYQDAYLRAADCHFMQRDYTKASAMYATAISTNMTQADYAYLQRSLIAGIKSSTEKIKMLSDFGKRYPKSSLVQEANMEVALAYIADEKFEAALPFLQLVMNSKAEGLKPKAYQKSGLAYYNANNNTAAIASYKKLIELYPQSDEAAEAISIIKDIYVEEGRPAEYVALLKANGMNISVSEADSLTYAAAQVKLDNGDCTSATSFLKDYLAKYPQGAYGIEANYNLAACYQKAKSYTEALQYFDKVSAKGQSKFYEKANLEQARINYFELKNYKEAKKYFEVLRTNAASEDVQLEALRGLVRTNYLLKEYDKATDAAEALINRKGINTDDKAVGYLVLGKTQQVAGNCAEAIKSFQNVAKINKTSWGAEARYEIANCQYTTASYAAAEKSALAVIKETGSYDEWVTKSYILLGDIFLKQDDYFNAKATYESVAKNASIESLKNEAKQKLEAAIKAEKAQSKLISGNN